MNARAKGAMGWLDLFDWGRADIVALHKTWFAFFLTFYVWFNMAPLATTIIQDTGFTLQQLNLLAICNVALTVPGRLLIGMLSDRLGPRRTFSIVMVTMALPCLGFAYGSSYTQLLVSRLLLSMVGTGFVVGIHMTSLWFKPKDIGFAQGVEAGLGNWGSSIAALTLPFLALDLLGSWRQAAAASGIAMLLYGVYYWFAVTDGPPGSIYHRPKKAAALEVSSWADLANASAWTVPILGVLGVLVWRIRGLGFMGARAAALAYAVIAAATLYQLVQLWRVNAPLLKEGVPEDDRYRFTDVACLCACYVATFGVELGVVSMLPAFFQKTFSLTPQMAGLIGSAFAILNFFSRALGGYISDRASSRRKVMLAYLAGVAATMGLMGLIDASWSLAPAVLLTLAAALFVTGGCGTTYAIVPLIKRRLTGQVSGYVGAYGNVGATLYLTALTFMSPGRFFLFIAATALATFVFCYFFLREPEGSFDAEYRLSSVDRRLSMV